MAGDEEDTKTTQAQIGEQLLAILKDSYGTSAGKTKVLMSDDAVVVFMDDLELQRSEEFSDLRGSRRHGHGDSVPISDCDRIDVQRRRREDYWAARDQLRQPDETGPQLLS